MPFESTVHVIDDDEALRDSLTFLLRTARLDVLSYPSATAFLEALPEANLSCVITDVRMPGMSGIDLLRRLRERKISVPVIVITGHGDIPLAVEAMRIGAIDFLEKPFDDEVLIASVKTALRQKEGEVKRHGERAGSPPCQIGSATSSAGWWPAAPTSRSPSISASARAPWRFTAPT
jgi:two-component system, LuxR family, response regulator FixJ